MFLSSLLLLASMQSPSAQTLSHAAAVEAATETWGQRQLPELEADERLAFACEKSPTSDPVLNKLRDAFRVRSCSGIFVVPAA